MIVDLDPELPGLTAKEVRVQLDRMIGDVLEVRPGRQLLLDGNRLVEIEHDATILWNTRYFDVPVDFGFIEEGDRLLLEPPSEVLALAQN